MDTNAHAPINGGLPGTVVEALFARMGPALTTQAVADRMGISVIDVQRERSQHRLLAIERNGDWIYPLFQFQGAHVIPGMAAVVSAYRGEGLIILDAILTPDPALLHGATLLDALRRGQAESVRRHIAMVTGDGFS